jgi:DNA-binding MarR family transcriptional regulator
MTTSRIEQQLTVLLRRVQSIHFSTSSGEIDLDRAAYGILCRVADHGPQRLGALAQAFGLDPSTITRQVQALEQAALVVRSSDPSDRRASLLDLSEEGERVLTQTRRLRRQWMELALREWSGEEVSDFARLLEKFNTSIDRLAEAAAAGEINAAGG